MAGVTLNQSLSGLFQMGFVLQVREAHVLQDVQRKLKKDKAEYEAAIQALKVHVFSNLNPHIR